MDRGVGYQKYQNSTMNKRWIATALWSLETLSSIPLGLQLKSPNNIFSHILNQWIEFYTFVMWTEIRLSTKRSIGIHFYKIRSGISVAHKRYPKCLDAMVNMHAWTDVRIILTAGLGDSVWMSNIVISPSILANEILRWRIKSANTHLLGFTITRSWF